MIPQKKYTSYQHIYGNDKDSRIRQWFSFLLILFLIILFLPWTQNIRARGFVTTLKQEQRPQQLNSVIPGKIIAWHVKEGDFVKKGDTLIQLSEIKDDYFDPALVDRTQEQLNAKQLTLDYYQNKVNVTLDQISALRSVRDLKLDQLENKIRQLQLNLQSDSIAAVAARNEFAIATRQLARQQALFDSGLVSLTQLEQRNQNYQNALAKNMAAENDLSNTRQDLTIIRLEINSVRQDYSEKISKAEADQYQAMSQIASGQGDLVKLQNQYTNYSIRSGLYYITAPQNGQITKARKAGIGEMIKEGEMLVEIVPDEIQYAVEIFVRPVDLPLLQPGQKVRLLFDGFPAIVFSGWPNASYGLYNGRVLAVENAVSSNGKFRMLVAEDPAEKPWPHQLKVGAGANSINLLKEVPIWYELWRNINGFPPDFYTQEPKKTTENMN